MSIDQRSTVSDWRQTNAADADLAVDGVTPRYVLSPTSIDELGQAVARVNEDGLVVIPRGNGTRMGLGMPPAAADLLVQTTALNRVIEYEPADLTLTIEAGATLGEVQRLLRAEGQFLALDPPLAEQSTLGGIIATNASGPARLAYGSARDLVIGTRVVNADGVATKAGGRVVKNVAGYDLNKLYIGSLGTVGIVVELSFKLWPLPPTQGEVLGSFDPESLARVLSNVLRSPLGPMSLEALDAAAAQATLRADPGPGRWLLAARYGGSERALIRQLADTERLFGEAGAADVQRGDGGAETWARVADHAAAQPDEVLIRLAVPLARTVAALEELRRLVADSGLRGSLQGRAGSGVSYAKLSAPGGWSDDTLGAAATVVERGRAWARGEGGSLVVEAAPVALKRRVDVWGDVGTSLRVMRAIKQQLDPRRTLNRGRFVGGI